MTILIHDLQKNHELDSKAMAGVRGGYAMYAAQSLKIMPHKSKLPGFYPAPHHVTTQSLSNFSEQLNIAIGSANVMQGNSNSVIQY